MCDACKAPVVVCSVVRFTSERFAWRGRRHDSPGVGWKEWSSRNDECVDTSEISGFPRFLGGVIFSMPVRDVGNAPQSQKGQHGAPCGPTLLSRVFEQLEALVMWTNFLLPYIAFLGSSNGSTYDGLGGSHRGVSLVLPCGL